MSAGSRRMLRTDRAGSCSGPAGPRARSRTRPSKYRFEVTEDVTVAKRPATEVAISRDGANGVRERMYFDDATGMLLRRDQIDARGRLVRRFAFVKMTAPQPVDGVRDREAPEGGQAVARGRARRARRPPGRDARAEADRTGVRAVGGLLTAGRFRAAVLQRRACSVSRCSSARASSPGTSCRPVVAPWSSAGLASARLRDVRGHRGGVGERRPHVHLRHRRVARRDPRDRGRPRATATTPASLEDIGRFVTAPFSWG